MARGLEDKWVNRNSNVEISTLTNPAPRNLKRKTENGKTEGTVARHEAITSKANGGEAPRSGQTGLLRRKELKKIRSAFD